MNPGVVSNIIMIVFVILLLTGWGEKTLRDGRLSHVLAACGLIVYLAASEVTFTGPFDVRWNLGCTLMTIVLTGWTLSVFDSWSHRLQYVLGVLTVSCALLVLMTLVPLDPAFFVLNGDLLYPLMALVISVVSVKRPFVAFSIAWVGLMIAASIDPLLHRTFDLEVTIFGSGETRDLLAVAGAGVLVAHGLYHATVSYLQNIVKGLRARRSKGGPEHA